MMSHKMWNYMEITCGICKFLLLFVIEKLSVSALLEAILKVYENVKKKNLKILLKTLKRDPATSAVETDKKKNSNYWIVKEVKN